MISRRSFITGLSFLPLAAIIDFRALAANPITMPERGLCAHRGCADAFPENTIPAFKEAVRLGAQMIEFDVQETLDGELVIMHDGDVKRTTDGKGKVSRLSFTEIRKLDAGIRKGSQFAGILAPTFEEVLDMMPRNVWLNCDMKAKSPSLAEKSARMIIAKNRQHQAFLACYDAPMRNAARKILPGIMICNNERKATTGEYIKATIAMKASFIQLTTKKYDAKRVSAEALLPLKQNHVRTNFFFLDDPAELKETFAKGTDFVLVNKLKDFLPAAREIGIVPLSPLY